MLHPVYLNNRYERVVSVFSRAGLPTELLRADFISEKVAGIDVTRTLQPRFGAAAVAASADVTALLNDSDFDESKEQAEDPSGIRDAIQHTRNSHGNVSVHTYNLNPHLLTSFS